MDKIKLKKQVELGSSIRQLADHFDCSYTTIRHWLSKYDLKTGHMIKYEKDILTECEYCKRKFHGKSKYCSNKCKSAHYYRLKGKDKYNKSATERISERRRSKKRELVKMKGGCCEKCGYNKNYSALTFHHIDPSTKKFGITTREAGSFPKEVLLEELSKCILLCHNCHMELHYPDNLL